eukprot:scaffold177517_cov20-Prasinocladus_malaysianus.AAC.1
MEQAKTGESIVSDSDDIRPLAGIWTITLDGGLRLLVNYAAADSLLSHGHDMDDAYRRMVMPMTMRLPVASSDAWYISTS